MRAWGPRVGMRGRVLEGVGAKGWCEGESVGGCGRTKGWCEGESVGGCGGQGLV